MMPSAAASLRMSHPRPKKRAAVVGGLPEHREAETAAGEAQLDVLVDALALHRAVDLRTVLRARRVRERRPQAAGHGRSLADRADDGDDLPLTHVTDHPALGDVAAARRQLHLEVDGHRLLGDRQILPGRPDHRLPGGLFQGDDARRKADAAEQRALAAGHRLVDLQRPAVRIHRVGQGKELGGGTTRHRRDALWTGAAKDRGGEEVAQADG